MYKVRFSSITSGFVQLGSNRGGGGAGVTDSGRLLNKGPNVAAIPIVYGDRRMGGILAYVQTTDASGSKWNRIFTRCISSSTRCTGTNANAIDDITAIQFNGT